MIHVCMFFKDFIVLHYVIVLPRGVFNNTTAASLCITHADCSRARPTRQRNRVAASTCCGMTYTLARHVRGEIPDYNRTDSILFSTQPVTLDWQQQLLVIGKHYGLITMPTNPIYTGRQLCESSESSYRDSDQRTQRNELHDDVSEHTVEDDSGSTADAGDCIHLGGPRSHTPRSRQSAVLRQTRSRRPAAASDDGQPRAECQRIRPPAETSCSQRQQSHCSTVRRRQPTQGRLREYIRTELIHRYRNKWECQKSSLILFLATNRVL